ncbi:MAG: hypothetical protein WC307_01930 [Candidatus Nanoarchaeia archaeon]|jgi:hypothetical protein
MNINEILIKNSDKIYFMWDRIRHEILTPEIKMYDKYKMKEIKELHPNESYCERRKLLKYHNQTPKQRQEQVMKLRNSIVEQELGNCRQEINKELGRAITYEELIDISKLILWDRLDWLEDKLNITE